MITLSLVYDHRGRTPKVEEGPVEVRVTVNRKPYYINTGVRVCKNRFVAGTIKDTRDTNDADILNERLKAVTAFVEQEVNKCLDERKEIDVAKIRQSVWSLGVARDDSDDTSLVDWIKDRAGLLSVRKSTRMKYYTLCNKMLEYGKITRWQDLSVEAIYDFDAWLHQQDVHLSENQINAGMEPRKMGDTGVSAYHKSLRAMLNRALKMGKIDANPYDRLRGEFKHSKRETTEYLTEDQMQKILDIEPVPGSQVDMARDLFIFQMYTGLAYVDTQRFDATQYREVDGKWKFIGERVKTGVPYVSMLLPPVVEVLKKYDWHVPIMNNQKYNQLLKAIGMVIGIERLHSHMGRHTFGTWMLSNGAKIENVSRMMGHTNITQTQRYAKVLAKDVYDDFDMVAEKLEKKKKAKD
jgi:integrase